MYYFVHLDSMSQIAKNIKFLRSGLELTQAKFGELFGWTRAAVSSYEDGRAVPPYSKLKDFASYFNLTVQEVDSVILESKEGFDPNASVVVKNTEEVAEKQRITAASFVKNKEKDNSKTTVENDLGPLFKNNASKPLKRERSIDTSHHLIQEVDMVAANISYEKLVNAPTASNEFPQMSIPLYQKGNFKAFEARSDSPEKGTWYIVKHVPNWFEIEDGKNYFIISESDGVFHRRVYNEIRLKGELLLSGLKDGVATVSIAFRAVDEIWQIIGELNYGDHNNAPALGNATRLAQELAEELKRLS